MTAQVIRIGRPVNEAERWAIAYLQNTLPDEYTLLHGLEVQCDSGFFAVGIVVVTPFIVYLVETRGTCGLIEAYGGKWYPENYQPYASPLLKLRDHTRSFKELLTRSQFSQDDLSEVFIDAVIFLTAPDAVFHDPSGHDTSRVITRKNAAAFFCHPNTQETAQAHKEFSRNTALRQKKLIETLRRASRPRSGLLRYGRWEMTQEVPPSSPPKTQPDYTQLAPGTQLTSKYLVEKRLGQPGSFGVVYKVIDVLGDVSRALKIILRDPHSRLDRLKREYRALLRLPEHPNVVQVVDADFLPRGGPPFIVFAYLDGVNVQEMLENGLFSLEDARDLACQMADGLVHLHTHGVYHCDIKPQNLLWTEQGARLIDFNVSFSATVFGTVFNALSDSFTGSARRYLPPDVDLATAPSPDDLADRDLYALGVTLHEAVTSHPFWRTTGAGGAPAEHPGSFPESAMAGLAPEFAQLIRKTIAAKRKDRFASAIELQAGLREIRRARHRYDKTHPYTVFLAKDDSHPAQDRKDTQESTEKNAHDTTEAELSKNTNPYVSYLLTLYSQTKYTNTGTRGFDSRGAETYVETALDRDLKPAVFAGKFQDEKLRLVLITGNAGDGKTAFLQRLEQEAAGNGAVFAPPLVNGSRFTFQGRRYLTNYDGSQDEEGQGNDTVLQEFFAPFAGEDAGAWPRDEIRLIAINEGRLVDFFTSMRERFPRLARVVHAGLAGGLFAHGVIAVNLNLRSLVVSPRPTRGQEADSHGHDDSIFTRLIRRLTQAAFWQPCRQCDLQDRCYALHNARTFQDKTAGPKVVERLRTLYTLTHLRAQMHITLRDLRSGFAYMLVGNRNCQEIHELYRAGDRDAILQGFYFNSWMGGDAASADRLLHLLKGVDVGQETDPRLDRVLDFTSPADNPNLFRFDDRSHYDRHSLEHFFHNLPRDFSAQSPAYRAHKHQRYVAMTKRREFFERRDYSWQQMLPYRSATRMLSLVQEKTAVQSIFARVLRAINRGEGLPHPERLGEKLALQVRAVAQGTIRTYRVFAAECFSLTLRNTTNRSRFVEHMPAGLVLSYQGPAGNKAELPINLDLFEMLERVGDGYRPSVEEEQGYGLHLTVFKNLLGSEPYREVLLTTTAHDFYRIECHNDGSLEMSELASPSGYEGDA